MNVHKYIKMARHEARHSRSEWKIGAVVVKGGKVIGRGYNRFSAQSNKVELKLGIVLYSLHAEMSAIMSSDTALQGAKIFVSGYKGKNGHRIYCRPCRHCMRMIQLCGIREVYYSTKSENIECVIVS